MKRVYTWTAKPAVRNLTIEDLRSGKGRRKFTQVTANTAEEASAAAEAGIDMIIGNSQNVAEVRAGNDMLFLTAAIGLPNFTTPDDILREAFRALSDGADAIMTARSMKVVETLANEDIPVMGHLGLVPRKSTWTGGLRAIGKTANEAYELFKKFKRLEDAGGALVEAEVIPGPVLTEITKRTEIITVSLGSGPGGDVDYLFMNDICGEQERSPRHAKAFGNLHRLYQQIRQERIEALKSFRQAAQDGSFPSEAETVGIDTAEMDSFLEKLTQH